MDESINQSFKQELQFGKGEAKAKSSRYKKNNMMMMMLTTMRSRPRGRLVLMMMMMMIASTVLISGCSGKKLLRTGGRNNNSGNRKRIITSMRKEEEEEANGEDDSSGSLSSQDDEKNTEAIEIENVDRTLGIFIDTDKSKSYFSVPAPAPAPAVNENERKSSSEESSSHHHSEHEEEVESKSETYFINDYYIQSMSMMMIPTYKPTVKPTDKPTTSAPYYNEPTYKPTTYKPTDYYQPPPPPTTDHYYPEHEKYYDDATTTTTNKGNKNSNVIQKCDSSIADIICNTNGFHLLCEALTMVGYTEFLSTNNPNQLTLFAPTDDAFEKLALAFPSAWDNLNSNTMSNLLLFHLTDANNGLRYKELLCNEWLHMMNGDYTFTHCISGNSSNDDDEKKKYQIGRGNKDGRSAGDSNEISLKDSPLILQKDIVACNGIIHSIDTVMLPSSW